MANYSNFDLRKFLAENKINTAEDVTKEVEDKLQEELEISAEENINEAQIMDLIAQNPDAVAAGLGVMAGMAGVVKGALSLDSYCEKEGNGEKKVCKMWASFQNVARAAGDAKRHRQRTTGFEEGVEETTELTKEEAFKKEIKDLLDS